VAGHQVYWDSIITRGRGRIGQGERHTFVEFFGCAVEHSLLARSSNSKDGKCSEYRVPVPLAKVVSDIVHVLSGLCPPILRVELMTGFNVVTSRVRLVCTFDLIWVSVQNDGSHQMGRTAAVTRARIPNGRFPGPGSCAGGVSMMPDEE